jgi:hypothetical protein
MPIEYHKKINRKIKMRVELVGNTGTLADGAVYVSYSSFDGFWLVI